MPKEPRKSGGFGAQTIAVVAEQVAEAMREKHGDAIPPHRVTEQSADTAMGLMVFIAGLFCFLLGAGLIVVALLAHKEVQVGWPLIVMAGVFALIGLYCVIYGAVAKATGEGTKAAKAAGGAVGAIASAARVVQRFMGKDGAER